MERTREYINERSRKSYHALKIRKANPEIPLLTDEIFKDVIGYEGLYKVSNIGRVWSVRRLKFLSQCSDKRGYFRVLLSSPKNSTLVHLLVWDAFGDKPRQGRKINVDHIDECKTNNHITNLQVLKSRDNWIKSAMKKGKLTGASWDGTNDKFRAKIVVGKKFIHIGRYDTAQEAHEAYLQAREKYCV